MLTGEHVSGDQHEIIAAGKTLPDDLCQPAVQRMAMFRAKPLPLCATPSRVGRSEARRKLMESTVMSAVTPKVIPRIDVRLMKEMK